MWANIKRNSVALWKSQKERKDKGAESLSEETMAENVSDLRREMDIRIQEAQVTSTKINLKRLMPRHVIFKLSNVTERNSKESKRKVPSCVQRNSY